MDEYPAIVNSRTWGTKSACPATAVSILCAEGTLSTPSAAPYLACLHQCSLAPSAAPCNTATDRLARPVHAPCCLHTHLLHPPCCLAACTLTSCVCFSLRPHVRLKADNTIYLRHHLQPPTHLLPAHSPPVQHHLHTSAHLLPAHSPPVQHHLHTTAHLLPARAPPDASHAHMQKSAVCSIPHTCGLHAHTHTCKRVSSAQSLTPAACAPSLISCPHSPARLLPAHSPPFCDAQGLLVLGVAGRRARPLHHRAHLLEPHSARAGDGAGGWLPARGFCW